MKIELVKELMAEFEKSDVYKMKLQTEELTLELEKTPVAVAAMPVVAPAPVAPTPVETTAVETTTSLSGTPIKSPIVGIFYPASSPTAKPYVEVGMKVTKGQTVCIIEAMKVMNEIKAPIDGIITAILVENEETVEYDQPIMMIEA